jgi:outer membrane protein TolC
MKKTAFLLLIYTFIIAEAAGAAEEAAGFDKDAYLATAEMRKTLRIGMVDCVAMALKANSEIQIKAISPKIEDSNVRIQKSKFEPRVYFDFLMEDDIELSPNILTDTTTLKTRTGTFNFGYEELFVTGTRLNVDFYNERTRTNSAIQSMNPQYDSELQFTVTQPLLKGFGVTVTKAQFLIAKNNKLISNQDFMNNVMKVLTDTKKSFYELQYAREQYFVAATSLRRVQDLHDINKEKYVKGLASNVDLLESEAEVARVEEGLYAAEEYLKKAEDDLKFITNLVDDVELWNADIVLLDEFKYEKTKPDLTEEIITAFDHRPDYEALRIDLKNKDISVIFYRNNMLPTLDLAASYGLNGLGREYAKDMDNLGSGKYPDWTIGVNFKLPLFSDKEKGEYEKSKFEKARALIAFKRLEQKIVLEVRNAVRDVDINYKKVEASRISKEAETKNYEAQESRFRAGLVSTLDMLIYLERLAKAELAFARSVIDYKISLAELARVKGTILSEDNITLELT